jgi:DNA-binding transcriptional ArsR family regulator
MRALGAATASTLDRTFAALADPTRRAVVELLRADPHRAGDLAAAFAMSPPAMSRHLRVLRKTGLVEESELDHDARVRVYRLRRERFAELRDWLAEVEAFWTDQLDGFKAHAERTRGTKAAATAAAAKQRRRSRP